MDNYAICLRNNKPFIKGRIYKAGNVYLYNKIPNIEVYTKIKAYPFFITDSNFCFIINPSEEIVEKLLN